MKLLLDTHTFLWGFSNNPRLSRKAGLGLADESNQVYLSAASVWEIALKTAKGNLVLAEPLEKIMIGIEERGLTHLPVTWEHAVKVQSIPMHHRDPFDRILAAQAMVEGLVLVTADKIFKKYGVSVLW